MHDTQEDPGIKLLKYALKAYFLVILWNRPTAEMRFSVLMCEKFNFMVNFGLKTALFWSKSRYFDMIMTSGPKIRPLRAKYGTHTLLVMLKLTVRVF